MKLSLYLGRGGYPEDVDGLFTPYRLFRAYKTQGAKGLISARRGKPSNHRLAARVVQQAMDLIYERYRDFGPTLAHEKLTEVHQLQLSDESVRQIVIRKACGNPSAPNSHRRTSYASAGRVLANWCRSTAPITPGSKSGDPDVPCWCLLTMPPGS